MIEVLDEGGVGEDRVVLGTLLVEHRPVFALLARQRQVVSTEVRPVEEHRAEEITFIFQGASSALTALT